MALFVDEITNHDDRIIRRQLMSNMSISELNTMASSLGIPLVDKFRVDRLPHYLLTEDQRITAISGGAKAIGWNTEEWRVVHNYAKNLPR